MSYLCYLCLFTYGDVQHILCCVFVFLRLVCPMLPVSQDCFCFVFLRLVYPMLPVSLDCSLLIVLWYSLTFIYRTEIVLTQYLLLQR
jgi:hypothetical protein